MLAGDAEAASAAVTFSMPSLCFSEEVLRIAVKGQNDLLIQRLLGRVRS